ncbi:hypothetical protein FF38_05759 [Lucilia cuprina]|uniref:Uncharacterized protein n=1 Tax=Lucilia cuprina TaxID=7375 RepID=A0A0L0C8K7_LUCCU|nr:hypothetical protein FF38_05759 [Lucilia cuprina]
MISNQEETHTCSQQQQQMPWFGITKASIYIYSRLLVSIFPSGVLYTYRIDVVCATEPFVAGGGVFKYWYQNLECTGSLHVDF